MFKPLELAVRGMVFNSMLEHLSHGEFDVYRAVIAFEGSLRDGKTHGPAGLKAMPASPTPPVLRRGCQRKEGNQLGTRPGLIPVRPGSTREGER